MEECYWSKYMFNKYFQLTKRQKFHILSKNKDKQWVKIIEISRTKLNIISIIIGILFSILFAIFFKIIILRFIFGIFSIILLCVSGYYFDELSKK